MDYDIRKEFARGYWLGNSCMFSFRLVHRDVAMFARQKGLKAPSYSTVRRWLWSIPGAQILKAVQ